MATRSHVRRRFWLEIAFVVVALVLWIATLAWPDWIELVFKIDPDQSGGSIERIISILMPAIGAFWLILSGLEWRRAIRVAATPDR
jgi:hypothetical protein